ncbi:cytochrome P450 [Artomyces pyxidatus]|uniref:Cytochrome P450 n=1 Tax=Artomyces pyxidatus TaxID=48021 RepID=A0ACB8T151_9AGAM|nr:cytochrome P450 [Artomyces pyxidatus]
MSAPWLLAMGCVVVASSLFLIKRNMLPHPPGPRPLPIIGNLFDLPKEASWLTYTEWAKTYGDIVSVSVLGQVIVVANTAKVAKELLEKRGTIYSDRPSIPFYDMMKWDWFLATAHYSDEWRTGRRILDHGMRPAAVLKYRGLQIDRTRAFLKRLLTHPEGFRDHIGHLQGEIIMSLVYGYDVQEHNDRYLNIAHAAVALAAESSLPGAAIVNVFPFLRYFPGWLPGMGFKALALKGRELGEEMVTAPFEFVKAQMRQGTARPSFTVDSLQEYDDLGGGPEHAERTVANVAGSLYMAGADTTSAGISMFFLMLLMHPDVQKRAQAELDAVVGRERMPTYEDRPNLPYIEAVCKELLRWKMVAPLGIGRATTADDVYQGYFVPKGAIVLANSWAILHDASTYPDPDEFKPERFLDADGSVRDDPALSAAFGFGKRICPGRHLVDTTMWIVAACVLSVYGIRPAKDEHGQDMIVKPDFTGALVSSPKPFRCSIAPRDGVAEKLILGYVRDKSE